MRRFSSISFHHVPRKAELGILLSIYQRRRPAGLRLFFLLSHCARSAAAASSAAAAALKNLGASFGHSQEEKKKGPLWDGGESAGMKGRRVGWRFNAHRLPFSTQIKQLLLQFRLLFLSNAAIPTSSMGRIGSCWKVFVSAVLIPAVLSEGRRWRCGRGDGVQGDSSTGNLGATSNGEWGRWENAAITPNRLLRLSFISG